jgi:hypothetical protein
MAEISKFFNSAPGDPRKYQASDFADYFGSVLSSGLLHTDNIPALQVKCEGTDLRTYVTPGKAIMQGYAYENTSNLYLEHALPEPTLDRIDRIVLRLDKRNQSRYIKLFVKQGTAATNPVPPNLQRDDFIYELSLAQIRVRANTSTLNPADLIDERLDENLCGLVHSLISIPTSQFQAEWDAFMASVQDDGFTPRTDFDTHLADYVQHPAYAVASGSANAYTVTLNPAPTSYVEGMAIALKINTDNTGASTINVNGLGTKAIKKTNGNDVSAGNLKAGSIYTLRYNGTNFILQGEGGSGNAQPSDVLSGKTFTNDSGEQTGTMPNRGAITITPGTFDQFIPAGYHNGNGKVLGDPDLISSNIKQGVNIFGVVGNLEPLGPGDNVVVSAITHRSHNSTSPMKLKEIRVSKKGTYRVKFDLYPNGIGFTAYARIYVNDVGRGILRSNNVNSSPITFTEDITINDNDLIQIYAWSSNDGFTAVVSNMTIGIDRSFTVNLN